jgi:hypothetical protein
LIFFERKRDEYLEQTKRMKRSVTVNDKALEASYHISLRIAKSKKPHTIAENLVLPSIVDTIKIFFGEEKIKEIEKIPLSDITVKRRIDDMGIDFEKQILAQIKDSKAFALQSDESTDISKKAQPLVYVRYVNCLKLNKELSGFTTGEEIFKTLDDFTSHNFDWNYCVSIARPQ